MHKDGVTDWGLILGRGRCISFGYGKGKVHPRTGHECSEGE
jgi:hypothetical protein